MSSHRAAPEISKDPVADSCDRYAFVSPDHPDTVTLIANYVPLQLPAGGPDFFEFRGDVRYEIHVDSGGDGRPDPTYQFRFRTELRNDRTFRDNTGPIESLDSENWNRRQFSSVTRVDANGKHTVLAEKLPRPPCNVGPLSIPDYEGLAADLLAIWLTGIPDGLVDGFQNHTGDVQADMLRLNTAVPPAQEPNRFGVVGGDVAGFPNGRRIDDVVSISLRVIAGATVPLVDEAFEPDAAAGAVEHGPGVKDAGARLLPVFPYLATPFDGSGHPS